MSISKFPQFMEPMYEGCLEKGVQHVATQAAQAAVGAAVSSSPLTTTQATRGGGGARKLASQSAHVNGKVKSS